MPPSGTAVIWVTFSGADMMLIRRGAEMWARQFVADLSAGNSVTFWHAIRVAPRIGISGCCRVCTRGQTGKTPVGSPESPPRAPGCGVGLRTEGPRAGAGGLLLWASTGLRSSPDVIVVPLPRRPVTGESAGISAPGSGTLLKTGVSSSGSIRSSCGVGHGSLENATGPWPTG